MTSVQQLLKERRNIAFDAHIAKMNTLKAMRRIKLEIFFLKNQKYTNTLCGF